jgi:3-phosphoshikimate 1-carboxyvinyltransferase
MYNTSKKIKGIVSLKGDKSLSHRALMIAALINDESNIYNISLSADVLSTVECLKLCGISIECNNNKFNVQGGTFTSPSIDLNCGNSGSTARMLMGLLAGQKLSFTLIGDKSLSARPMKRIIEPLKSMGVSVESNNYLPAQVKTVALKPIRYSNSTKSAQVKSAIIFASLACNKYSYISFNESTRNHTEKMMKSLGFDIDIQKGVISVRKSKIVTGFTLNVPGDISNASFLVAAAVIIPDSDLIIKKVLYNKTRFGFIDKLIEMGAKINIDNIMESGCSEMVCDIRVQYTKNLNAVTIKGDEVICMIDEIPIFCIVATQANGISRICDSKELKYKESDRLLAIYTNLRNMNAEVYEIDDGLSIKGKIKLYSTSINHFNDHRIAMSFEILNLLVNGEMSSNYSEIIDVSFPEFYKTMKEIVK